MLLNQKIFLSIKDLIWQWLESCLKNVHCRVQEVVGIAKAFERELLKQTQPILEWRSEQHCEKRNISCVSSCKGCMFCPSREAGVCGITSHPHFTEAQIFKCLNRYLPKLIQDANNAPFWGEFKWPTLTLLNCAGDSYS